MRNNPIGLRIAQQAQIHNPRLLETATRKITERGIKHG